MKTRARKITSLLLALTLVFGLFTGMPLTASAAGPGEYEIVDTVSGANEYTWDQIILLNTAIAGYGSSVQVTIVTTDSPLSAVTLNLPNSGTVVGDGVTTYDNVAILYSGGLTIENLSISSAESLGTIQPSGNDATITVIGTCSITNTATTNGWGAIVYNNSSTLTIDGVGTLTATGVNAGIRCYSLDIDATVTAHGPSVAGVVFYGDAALNVDGSLTAEGTGTSGNGVSCDGDLTISGTGTINITGVGSGHGIYANSTAAQNITFDRSVATTVTGGATGNGLHKNGTGALTVINNSSGAVTIEGGTTSGYGIQCLGDLNIGGTGSGAIGIQGRSSGIYTTGTEQTLTVSGSPDVTITGIGSGNGIRKTNSGLLTVNNNGTSALTIEGGAASGQGIDCYGDLNIGGTGSGAIDIKGGGSGAGIYTGNSTDARTLTFNHLTPTTITGGSYGIHNAGTGKLTIVNTGNTLAINGGDYSGVAVNGDLEIAGTKAVGITAGGVYSGISLSSGVAAQTFTVSNTAGVNATGGTSGSGINLSGSGGTITTVSGATFAANGGSPNGSGIGSSTAGANLTLAGAGTITASAIGSGAGINMGANSLTLNGTVTVNASGGVNGSGLRFSGSGKAILSGAGQTLNVTNTNTVTENVPLTKPSGFNWDISGTDITPPTDAMADEITQPVPVGKTATISLLYSGPVCKNTTTNAEFTSFAAAVTAATNGQTIQMLTDYTETTPIVVDGKTVNLDVGSYTLTLDTSGTAASIALSAQNGGKLLQTGTGKFNITGAQCGVEALSGAQVTITGNVTAADSEGAYAENGAVVTITGDVKGGNYGVKANDGAKVAVTGDVTGTSGTNSTGAYAKDAEVTITGDVEGGRTGVDAYNGGKITVNGDVTGTSDTGAYAEGTNSVVTITGDVEGGNYGVYAARQTHESIN